MSFDPKNVNVGDAMPMLELPPISRTTLALFAGASGDHNPIHLYPLTAKALGFPRQIAHGMWSKARCIAALENRLPEAVRVIRSGGDPGEMRAGELDKALAQRLAAGVVDGEAVMVGHVEVDAGLRWNALLERTSKHGLMPPTLTGSPASTIATRAMFMPCSPSGIAQPMIASSIVFGSRSNCAGKPSSPNASI